MRAQLHMDSINTFPQMLYPRIRRWRIDGGFVTEVGRVTGNWRRSLFGADQDAIECFFRADREETIQRLQIRERRREYARMRRLVP